MSPRGRHALIAAALATSVALATHPLWPDHPHPWDAHEAHAAALPTKAMTAGSNLTVDCPTALGRNNLGSQRSDYTCSATGTPQTPVASSYPTIHMQPSDTLTVTCPTSMTRNNLGALRTDMTCAAASGTATPTAMPTATATKPPATATSVPPTATSPPAATNTPSTTMIEGVPVCTDHNKLQWHPLVKKDSAGKITCTYGHEHHANPNDLNDVFGTPGAWFGASGQSISYPWQTSGAAGLENDAKHEGYKWMVQRNQPCRPAGGPTNGCFVTWRVLVHQMAHAGDATARFHSFSMEAVIEYQGRRGIFRHGGHLDFGHLDLNADGARTDLCPPIPSNPPTFVCGQGPAREHSSENVPAPHTPHYSYISAWYSDHEFTNLSTNFDEWGPIDYQNPFNQLFFPVDAHGNGSYGSLGNMGFTGGHGGLSQYVVNGLLNRTVWTDQFGKLSTCTAVSPTCVPLRLENVPAVDSTFNTGVQGDSVVYTDYDVPSPVTGKSLIRFPN